MSQRIIQKVGCAVFKDYKVLMVETDFGGDAYYFLGGTVEPGESDIECLVREVKEEAAVKVVPESIKFLGQFTAPAHGRESALVVMRLYSGELIGDVKASDEVTGIVYCDSTLEDKHHTLLSKIVFPWLKGKGLIS
jgi:8-oxo-dGTP diphosphatase